MSECQCGEPGRASHSHIPTSMTSTMFGQWFREEPEIAAHSLVVFESFGSV